MTRVRERRRQSFVACRFVHEVQYHTMISITAVAATGEERVSPHRPPCVYNRSVVHQSTAEKPTHQQSTIPPCAYNNRTAVQQRHKRKRRDRVIQLTLCLSSIERSNVEPTEHILISCRLREGNFKKIVARRDWLRRPFLRQAAVWVGLGALARPRGIGRHP